MKIAVENLKPRAKWLNDLLRAKRSERHSDPRKPTRNQQKSQVVESSLKRLIE